MKKLRKAISWLLLVTMMLGILVGCGSDDVTDSGSGDVELVDGDWEYENRGIVTSLQAAASTSDPFGHANVNDREWILNAYEPLFCNNGLTGELEPRVGKSLEISEDETTYTVEIFDNIYFQNGKHCTSEDIKRSFEYGQTSAFNLKFSGIVDRVEIVDDYTVDIVLKEPSSPFLSNSDQIYILDMDEVEEQGDRFGQIANTAGTGAYYIEKYDPAVEIVLKRHEKFHREIEGRPIPQITFRVMTDLSAALMAFEAGDLDFISNMPPSNFGPLEATGKFSTHVGQTTQLMYTVMNFRNVDGLEDTRVRQAVAYALDYQALLDIGQEGFGHISGKIAYAPYTIAAPDENSGLIYTHDPEKSKELLKEAGYEDGFDLGKILVAAGTNTEKMAQVMQGNLAEVGITSSIDSMEQVTTISNLFSGNFGTGIITYYMMMDYDYITGIMDMDGNEQAIIRLDGAEDFDYQRIYDLFHEARKYTDEDKRREIYTEIEEILMEAAIIIPNFHTALPYAWDQGLTINTDKPYTYHYSQFWDAYWN
ncbi:MAG TPA: ABC transporter substrate-binding protein [Tissierellaceae bacterium]|nr:ABC transporter substrate-binding protein [Tissierellaceae bacterium]